MYNNYQMSLKELKDKICNNNKLKYEIMSYICDWLVRDRIHGIKHMEYNGYDKDKIFELNETTYTNKNDTMRCDTDFHCWVIREDGSIYNPEFKVFDTIKERWSIDKDEPIILEPFSKELQIECLKTVMSCLEVEKYLREKTNGLDELSNVDDILTYLFVKDPIFGKCWCNSWYYKKLYGGKFVIGRMGWRKKDGTVYYEFG